MKESHINEPIKLVFFNDIFKNIYYVEIDNMILYGSLITGNVTSIYKYAHITYMVEPFNLIKLL